MGNRKNPFGIAEEEFFVGTLLFILKNGLIVQ
jgi:hypothetical protein